MTRSRAAVAVLAAVTAVTACGHRAPGAADAAAPPKAAFVVYPPDRIAGVKDPHDHQGKALCQRCHLPDLGLTNAPNALCTECHRFGHGNHPVDVVQRQPVEDLPLLAGGALACHTCHDPHQKRSVLRKPFDALCKSCHAGH